MKKAFVLFLCVMFLASAMLRAAFAAGLSLPEMSTCVYGVTLDNVSDSSSLYTYFFDSADARYDAISMYIAMLDAYYDFDADALGFDEVSSDMFTYYYLPKYDGDASISPMAIDNYPEPCYILFIIIDIDQRYMLMVEQADGIDFNAQPPTALTQDFAAENGTRLMDPALFSDGAVYCSSIHYSDNPIETCDSYVFSTTSDDLSNRTVAMNYVNAMLNSGYYELLVKAGSLPGPVWYNLNYIGSSKLPRCYDSIFRIWDRNTDITIRIGSELLFFDVHPSLGFLPEPVAPDYPSADQ